MKASKWTIAVLAGVASVAGMAKASTVTLTITASGGTWDLYGSDSATDNAGIADFDLDVIGSGGLTVTGSTMDAPQGVNGFSSTLDEDNDGITPGMQIIGAQNVTYNGAQNNTKDAKVYQGVGQTPGTAEAASVTWLYPVLLADGTYSGTAGTLTANVNPGNTIQTLNGTGPGTWKGPTNVSNATTVLGSVTLPSSGSGPTPIVSLTAQGSQIASITAGTSLPLLHVVGSNGSYVKAHDSVANLATAYAEVTGFSPAGDNETYALKLNGSPTPTQIATIITDINTSSATDGVVALVPTADIAALVPGYQIELTASTSKSADQSIGFNFSQETNVAGITVSDIVAVPEPASIGLLMGASGLILGRRKRKA